MRKITQKWAFLMMTLVCLLGMSQVVTAQNCVEIGDGTTAGSSSLPVASWYHYSYTQQLFTADEIEQGAGNIVSIGFQYNNSSSMTRKISIYMANTDEESLTTSWFSEDLTEVLSPTVVTFDNSEDWVVIELETPFAYAGENLVVAVYQEQSAEETLYSTGNRFLTFSSTGMTVYKQSDSQFTLGDDYVPTTTGSTASYRTNTQFCIVSGGSSVIPCDKPSGITASDVTAHAATLAWADGSGVYNVEYKKASDEEWTPFLTATTLLTGDLMNLEANTDYQARVQSVCADNLDNPTSKWKSVDFKTAIGLPFAENFDASSSLPTGWQQYTGLVDEVMAGTASLSSATYGWSINSTSCGDFTSSHLYQNVYGSSKKSWIVMPRIPMEANTELTFDLAITRSGCAEKTPGAQDDDKFVVLISTDSMATWTILRQWDNAGSEYVFDNISNTGEEVKIDLGSYAGENAHIALYAESTSGPSTGAGDNYFHIDNILIDYIPSCLKPTDLHVVANSTTSNSVELEWTANSSEEAWILQYKKSSENAWQEVNVTENPYQLENLEAYTNYDVQVAAVCDAAMEDGTSKYSKAISFKTAATVPFVEDFNATSLPGDWTHYKVLLADVAAGDTVPTTPVSAGWLASSTSNGVFPAYDGHLKLQVYGADVQHWIVSPYIEMDDNMQLTFDLALTKSTGNLEPAEAGQQADDKFAVLITTDGGESWEEIYTRDNVSTEPTYDQISCSAEGEMVKIDLTAYASDKIAFAFYGESTEAGGSNYLHIANVHIDTIPDCEKPTGLQLTAKSDISATFTWDEVEGATWAYGMVVDTFTVTTFVPADEDFTGSTEGMAVTIDTLRESTSYIFFLRRDCGDAYSEAVARTVTTFPAPIQAPWGEDFESFAAETIAENWDNSASSTTTITGANPHYVWGVYAYGGNKMIRMYNYYVSTGTAIINTPNIALPLEPAYELTFDYAHTATCGDFSVKISADGGASWATQSVTYGKTSTGTDKDNPGEFTEAQIDLSEYAGSTIMIQFFANANYGSGAIFIDNVSVHEIPSCVKPQGLVEVEESATTNSVQLDWDPQGTETNWFIQYKKADAEDWTVFDGDVNAHPFTLTGLSASSTYNVRVAAWCDPTDSLAASEYSNAISVVTACDVISTFPYAMNFDGMEGVTSGNVLPICWEYVNTVTGSTSYDYYPTVYKGSTYANSGTNSLKLLSYYNYEGKMYAILPEMEGLNALRMKFNARAYSASTSYTNYDATFVVGILNSPADTANFVALDTITAASTTYAPYEVKFNTYEGTGKHIAIKMVSPDYYGIYDYNGVYIDDIVIDPIPDCYEPSAVKVVETTANSMKFTYTASAEGDSLSYAVVAKGVEPAEFIGVAADTVLVEGLEAGTEYELYLRTECANSHSVALSAAFQTKQLPIDLGDGFADDFEGANLWTLENGAIENAWVIGTAAHNGEGSTKALYISNDGGASHAYTHSASTVFAMKSFNIADGSYVFKYDWLANGESTWDFMRVALVPASIDLAAGTTLPTGVTASALPDGLIAIDGGSKQNLSTEWATYTSEEIAVPAGTYNVVFMWRNDGGGGTQPPAAIDNFSIAKVLCGKPGTPTIDKANITSTSAEIAWLAEEGQTEWILAMDTIAAFNKDSVDLQTVVTANPYLAENLLPDHTYYVYVRAICGDNFSAWSARSSFKTAKSCQKPDGLDVTAITDSSAVITWNTYGQSDFHLVYYITTAQTDTVAVTGGSYTITGLEANTTYKVKVAADCDLTSTGFSGAKTFKTACVPAATVVENFDGITGSTSSNVLPDCWSYINTGSSSSYYPTAYAGATYANSGDNSLKFYTYASTSYADQYAILPAVEGLNELRIKFNARKYSTSYEATIVVGIMTDPTDAATFVAIDTVRPAGATYEPFMVSFGEYAGEGMYAAFKVPVPASSYNGAYIDDVELEEIPSCLEPTNLAVSEISTNGATLDWVSAASQWQIILNGDTIEASEKPYVLSELTPATIYNFMVRAICAEGDTSAWSKTAKFVTECEVISLANGDYVQDFESFEGTAYSAAGVTPTCWEVGGTSTYIPHVVDASGSYAWAHSGTKSMNLCASANSYAYAILPSFAEPINQLQISFWYRMESLSYGTLALCYVAGDSLAIIKTFANTQTVTFSEDLMLDTIPASAENLAIAWIHNGTSFYSCTFDDITVSLIPPCPKSTGLHAAMVGDTLATIAWDAEEEVAWEYGLVLDTVADFEPTDADFTGSTVINEVSFDTLAPQTAYLFFLRKICGDDKSPIVYLPFKTAMRAAALPYDDDFENGNNWMLVNGNMTNAWTVGAAATESGNALYISNDGGTTFEYTVTSPVIVYAAKVFNFAETGNYTVSYDWRANGESNYDYLRVALVPASVELEAATSVPSGFSPTGLPTGWKALDGGSKLNLSDAWQTKSETIESLAPGYYYVVFAWRNDNSTGAQSPAAVDNIHIQHVDDETGIGNAGIEGAKAIKFIRNNQVYILINGTVYNVTGQKVEVK